MITLNANDLKIGGVSAIEAALQKEPEAVISVRGERRYVVMELAQYQHLRECELEAAWLATKADISAGRARTMTAAQHIAEIETFLRGSAAAPVLQQERATYRRNEPKPAPAKTKTMARTKTKAKLQPRTSRETKKR